MPWKSEKDPYKIWLSEVILQQTTVGQGLKYYLNFIETFPNITALAQANDQLVYKMWEGLGYYSRCQNLLIAARVIADKFNGNFPDDYTNIINLPGVGAYTAAAIMSFAYNHPIAVVDGNVYRVLSRYFGDPTPIDTTEGRQHFAALAQSLLSKNDAASYNQAIMDFGATVCTPRKPLCESCPLQINCKAFQEELDIKTLPFKSKKLVKSKRYFHFIILQNKAGDIYIEERTGKDVWQHLHQPFLIETETEIIDINAMVTTLNASFDGLNVTYEDVLYLESMQQTLTHRVIQSTFYLVQLQNFEAIIPKNGAFVTKKNLKKLAFPQTIFSFMSKNSYF